MIVWNKPELYCKDRATQMLVTSLIYKNSNWMQPKCLAMGSWVHTVERKLCYWRNLSVQKINMGLEITGVMYMILWVFLYLYFQNVFNEHILFLGSEETFFPQITCYKWHSEASRILSFSIFRIRTWWQTTATHTDLRSNWWLLCFSTRCCW